MMEKMIIREVSTFLLNIQITQQNNIFSKRTDYMTDGTKIERMVVDFSQGMVIIIFEPPTPHLVVREVVASLNILSGPADNRDQFSHDAHRLHRRVSWDYPGVYYAMTRHVPGNEEKCCFSWLSPPGGNDCLSAATVAASGLDWVTKVVEEKSLRADGNTSWEECKGRNC